MIESTHDSLSAAVNVLLSVGSVDEGGEWLEEDLRRISYQT